MKLDKSFLTLFVGLAMAACSNDEEMATGLKVREHALLEKITEQRTNRM